MGVLLHRLARLAMILAVLAMVGVGWLGWRLAQGPLDLPWLTRYATHAIEPEAGGLHIAIGHAALAWEGFRLGVDSPLDIRLSDVVIDDPVHRQTLRVPHAAVSLSIAQLLLGRLRPRAVVLDGLALDLVRLGDGSVRLGAATLRKDTQAAIGTPAAIGPPAAAGTPPLALAGIIDNLARPPIGDRDTGGVALLSQMRRLKITDAHLTLIDRRLGALWTAPTAELDLKRRTGGGLDGSAHLLIAVAGGHGVPLDLAVHIGRLGGPAAGGITVAARLGTVSPVRLAAGVTRLHWLAAVDAPVNATAALSLTPALALAHFALNATIGAGTLHMANGAVRLGGATLAAAGTPDAIAVNELHVALTGGAGASPAKPGGDAAPGATLQLSGTMTRMPGTDAADAGTATTGPGWRARLHLGLDRVDFATLPTLWPPGLAHNARVWVTGNITQGIAQGGHADLTLTTGPDFADPVLSAATGAFAAHGLTVFWLRPVPPLLNGVATLHWLTPDRLSIDVASTTQQGPDGKPTGLTVTKATVGITGLTQHDQIATIDGTLAGPIAQALTLLAHPRLHLLADHPFPLRDPGGTFSGTLNVSVPLDNDVRMDQIGIAAKLALDKLHLSAIVAGQDLDQGEAVLQATPDGLTIAGTARIADVPAHLSVAMDFRAGPPDQVLEHVTMAARVTPAGLAHAGLDTGGVLAGGAADLGVDLSERRDGIGTVDVKAGLTDALLRVAPLNWEKPAGEAANGTARVSLLHDRLTAVSALDLSGPSLSVAGKAGFAKGQLARLDLTHLRLGATEASGSIDFPARAGDPLAIRLSGPMIDLSARLGHHAPAAKPAKKPAAAGPVLAVAAHFASARMAHDIVVRDLTLDLHDNGHIMQTLSLGGTLPAGTPFSLRIAPQGGVRHVTAETKDAGELLRALDVLDSMQGGNLSVTGQYDDTKSDHTLNGTATIDSFRVRGAPALGRLLQAMTLYGLVDVVAGPGLAFNKLIAPFSLDDDALVLHDARAFSASLGLTAKGRIDFAGRTAALQGTIVPAYFFNTLLGHIPLLGRLFSPEKGGGLFAASYSVTGNLDDPKVSVNPLAALTPGVLRGLFGLFSGDSH